MAGSGGGLGWAPPRVALAAVVGSLLVGAALLGQSTPLQAQEEDGGSADAEPRSLAEISISGLSGTLTNGGSDSFTVEVSNLTTAVGYNVIVSRNNTTLGIGACGTASQSQLVSGVDSKDLTFTVYACGVGSGTVEAKVRRTSLHINEAAYSQTVTVQAAVTAPAAPARPTAPNPQPREFTARWAAPSNTGGAALTGYHVVMRADGASWPGDDQAQKVGATTHSYTYRGLSPNRIYWFKVKACNGANQTRCSGWSDQASVTLPIGHPGTPSWGSFDNGSREIRVTWSAPGDTGGVSLTGYGLRHWREGTSEPTTAQATVNGRTTARTFRGLEPATTYTFSIQACNGTNRCSSWTNKNGETPPESTATPSPTAAPEAPGQVGRPTFTDVGQTEFTVNWTAPNDNGTAIRGYSVQWRQSGSTSWTTAWKDADEGSHEVIRRMANTTYVVQVKACNGTEANGRDRCGAWSRDGRVTTAALNVPGTVQNLEVDPGDRQLGVNWDAPAAYVGPAVTRYVVQYGEQSASGGARAIVPPPRWLTHNLGSNPLVKLTTILSLTNLRSYAVQVRACNGPDDDDDCGDWAQASGTPEAPRPRNLDVVPLAWSIGSATDRSAMLTWEPVSGTVEYEVKAQVLGEAAWHEAKCTGEASGKATRPQCDIDLDFIAGLNFGLHNHKAYALQVRAYRPQLSAYSEPVVIVDTPIFRAKGASTRVDVSWTQVDAIHSDLNAGGRYQLRYRRFRGDHTSVDWDPEDLGFLPTRPTALLPVGTTAHPIGSLVNYELYAIQLLYNAPQPNAAPIKVFAARDAYAWPSDRAAGAGDDQDGNFYAGERVGTFPLWPTAAKTTYAYHICSDTFPTTGGAPDPGDELGEVDFLRTRARSFIQHALGQWETATSTGPGTSLITMNYLDTQCANYDELINPIVDVINADYSSGLSDREIREHVESVLDQFDLAELTKQDKKLNEVIYVDIPDEKKSEVYFSDVSEKIGLHPCGLEPLACAPRTENVDTIDILLYGGSFTPAFTWDIPTKFSFSQCSGADNPSPSLYATVVHEGGHALGISGTTRSGGSGDQYHHSQVEDSVVKTGGIDACTPTPFDVMALYALYQTVD